ncbi:hypothetical protein [Pseudomonas sp.]|uniref:hypothetical protein n=1 Tax=Pseudomonas sp. TaxID=306 RepID=UPI001266FAD9|nr:hypothetical protein [Pseudomonas sp.]QGW22682.1 hypothetical protein GOM96_17290 [Stutzerimonas degradans]
MHDGVHDRIITETFTATGVLNGVCIGTFQEDFSLCEADFLRLLNEGTALTNWALNILFISIGYGMSIAAKWFSHLTEKTESVSNPELLILALGFLTAAILSVIGKFLPSERKTLINKISNHFKTAPKSRQFFREGK